MSEPLNAAPDFAAQFAALRAQYAKQLGITLSELARLVAGQGPEVARATLEDVHARLHKLAGSGGTFGFPELSHRARALEVTAKTWLDAATPPAVALWQVWQNELLTLPQALSASTADSGQLLAAPAPPAPGQREHVRVVLIEDDLDVGGELSQGLGQFGYEVAHFPSFAAAEATLLAEPPDVLVVDIMLPGQDPADGTEATPLLFAKLGYRLPTVFLTARRDFSTRLAAARAGGGAFVSKPADVPSLAASIELLLQEGAQEPYRVLIVDDDEFLAEHYRLILVAAGMLAEKVCHPQDTLEAIQQLRPDLLLLDLYMPECSGAELARAIRYDEAWQGMPIVYLSAESDLDQQIKAMGSGADDFLTKPISDVRLVAAVRARAARARKLSELMSQDSLTGLLKHASIKDRLAQELDRAQRQGKPLAVAMVDIDHFKQVNDRWGHPMGDQVIKTLAHLLRQRLRRQDSIGRYGGEEFVAILPECTTDDAVRLLDDIRLRFGEVRFVHQGQSFAVTLSAGVASSAHHAQAPAPALLAAADGALYEAKHGGRNQIRLASPGAAGHPAH